MASKDEGILKRIHLIQSVDALLNDCALGSNEQTTIRMEELKLSFEDEIEEYKSSAEWQWSPGKVLAVNGFDILITYILNSQCDELQLHLTKNNMMCYD